MICGALTTAVIICGSARTGDQQLNARVDDERYCFNDSVDYPSMIFRMAYDGVIVGAATSGQQLNAASMTVVWTR